jgi:hypothetical protein
MFEFLVQNADTAVKLAAIGIGLQVDKPAAQPMQVEWRSPRTKL